MRLGKYGKQLDVLSKLRKIQSITSKLVDIMITYDLETDVRYLQGIEKGVEKGIEKGTKQERKNTEKIIRNLHIKMGLTSEQIANMCDLELSLVESVLTKKTK